MMAPTGLTTPPKVAILKQLRSTKRLEKALTVLYAATPAS